MCHEAWFVRAPKTVAGMLVLSLMSTEFNLPELLHNYVGSHVVQICCSAKQVDCRLVAWDLFLL